MSSSNKSETLAILAGVIALVAHDCWNTGCQPYSWAVTGCGQYGMVEVGRSRSLCPDGANGFYRCCHRTSQRSIPSPSRNAVSTGGRESRDESALSITYSQFSHAVTSNGGHQPGYNLYSAFIHGLPTGLISNKQETAMALANILQESDLLSTKEEYGCGHECSQYAQYGCDAPGRSYHGRGYIQLTGCSNYKRASVALYGNDRLVHDPDLVSRDENVAWATTFWYWKTMVHERYGVAQGKFGASIKAINPRECRYGQKSSNAGRRVPYYRNVRRAFGLRGNGDESGCYN